MEKWISLIILTCIVYRCDSKTYRIAWMSPGADSGQEINSYTSVAALKLALESVAVNPMILNGHNIEVKYFNTDCSPHASMKVAMDAKQTYNPDVFIGPPCQDGMRIVAQLCTFWNLPVFTWYNPGIEFDGTTTYPTLIRMIPSLNIMGHSLVHLMRQNNWDQFVLVYDNSNPWSLYDDAVRTEVDKTHIQMWGSHDVNTTMTNEDIRQLFIRIKQHTRIVVFACPNEDIRRYMIVAEAAGMADGNFVFIQLDHQVHSDQELSTVILSDKRWKKQDLDDGAAKRAYQSLVHVLLDPMHDDETPTYALPRNRYDEFARMSAGQINKTKPGWELPPGGQSDVYSLYLYDTVLVWSVLLDKLRTAGISERDGKLMAHEASLLVADGATGFISLNDDNDRIGKIFIMSMDTDGAFKPTEILKFNTTNGYDAIRIKPMNDRVIRLFGARTNSTSTVDTVKVVPVQPMAPEHPEPILSANAEHKAPVEARHVHHTSESELILPVAPVLPVVVEPVPASQSVDSPVVAEIHAKTPTTKRPRPPRPPALIPSDSKPPRPPTLIPTATPTPPITTKAPSDLMIEKLMLRLQSLEKQIKDHESHAHQHIPDHTHTPHPLLKQFTTPTPLHPHPDVHAHHAHRQPPPIPTLHHSQTVTDHPHTWHLHHPHQTMPTPYSQSQNFHSKSHAHITHTNSQAHHAHINSDAQNANSNSNSIDTNSINHVHSSSNSQNAEANVHVHSNVDNQNTHSNSHAHNANTNSHSQNAHSVSHVHSNSHAHNANSQTNQVHHSHPHLNKHAHLPTTIRTATIPTTAGTPATTVLPVTTPIVTPAVTQALVQENGQINDQMLDRISSRLVDQLLGVPSSPQNTQQTTNTSASQTKKETSITNDWLANNLDEIGPGLVFLRIARDQQIRNAEADRRYKQALQQRQLLQQQLLIRQHQQQQQQHQQNQETIPQEAAHSNIGIVENPASSQQNWSPYTDPLATIFDPIMGIWDPMIPPPTTYPRPW
ncbi:hypothetical protein ACF0H5_016125 [Mactra antiquata]